MKYDLIIIGSGPAGYVAAIRAGQTGLKTAVVEEKSIGGMCLNWGCIPTKSLLESARKLAQVKEIKSFGIEGINPREVSLNWLQVKERTENIVSKLGKGIEYLFKKNRVDYIQGLASISSPNMVKVNGENIETSNILISTGSKAVKPDLMIPGDRITEVYDFLLMDKLPERPVILGSNPNAIEMAQFFSLAGKKTYLLPEKDEMLEAFDKSIVNFVKKMLKASMIEILDRKSLTDCTKRELVFKEKRVEFDIILNCSDRKAVLPESEPKLELEEGFLKVNGQMETSIPGIYGAGDVTGKSSFAHISSAQGIAAVNKINGIIPISDLKLYPINMYTWPEIAQIGRTEQDLKFEDINYNVTKIPFTSNGKALIEEQRNGFIRILSEKEFGEVLGVQIVAENATDMIAEAAVLIQLEGTVYDLGTVVHSHPTVSEVFMEGGYSAFSSDEDLT